MPPEADWVRSWLQKAEEDALAAERLLAEPPVLPGPAAFHSQQAVEKLLKGYLVYHDVEFEALRDQGEPLTRYAVLGRYPIPGQAATEGEARQALEVARVATEFVTARLPGDVLP